MTAPAASSRSSRTPRDPSGYTARHLSVLEGLEAVRKRPGMYIGSTDTKGLTQLAFEIIDNAVDEALANECDRIEVTLHPDGSLEVDDNGRGIPVDVEAKSGLTGVELVLTKLHAGGKFGGGSYKTSGGLHGVGASVVNALSARLDVVVRRNSRVHTMSFARGVPGVFADGKSDPTPDAKFTPRDGLSIAGKAPAKRTGTTVRWWADVALFSKSSAVDVDQLRARLRQTAFLVQGLTLALFDKRGAEVDEETFVFLGGTVDFVEHLAPDAPVCDPIHLVGDGHYKETVPVLDDKGHMSTQTVERHCEVDVALRWGTGYDTVVQAFCNVVATPHGGTHQNGFERALLKSVNEALVATRVHKAKDDAVIKDDVLEGLTAVVTVKVPEPQYLGQTKDELGTPGVSKIVADVVSKQLKVKFFEQRKSKAAAKQVLEKVAAAAKTRQAARASKDAARRKTALETSTLPAKLADCRSTDVSRTELWLVEGDSALGTGKLARNSEYQALLPLRGKILNVQKASASEMLGNAECASIIQVVGAGTGRTFDLDAMRYHRVVLMADADVDGAHIRCLLITLFARYMRPVIESGRLYTAVPPLHRVEVVGADKPIYTYTDKELTQVLKKLDSSGKRVKGQIQRFKGLGEMDPDQLAETTMHPATRTMRRIRVGDAEAAERALELLMGNDVAPRRDFIIDNAARVNRELLDT
ncbi:MAG: type IIA DNA topoisomerase subunit B [Frankiaceae bacterium]|nr:type IIA DNA topoisomerase subunit B [Frankiaceae bacterium]